MRRYTVAELLERAQALCELQDDELNPWEAEFVDEITKTLELNRELTNRQHNKLNQLYQREFPE